MGLEQATSCASAGLFGALDGCAGYCSSLHVPLPGTAGEVPVGKSSPLMLALWSGLGLLQGHSCAAVPSHGC